MALMTCRLCEKVFTSAGGRTCPNCLSRLDELYPRVRQYMRDNPKSAFNIESLSEELDTDVRMIQALVDMGYLDRDAQRIDTASREKLAKEFGESLKQMKEAAAFREAAKGAASYGMQRYGEKANKK